MKRFFSLLGSGLIVAAALMLIVSTSAAAQAVKVDSKLPDYSKTSGVSGNFSSVGSDTLANLMTFWSEAYHKVYPNVNVQIEAKGSSTAPPALIEGASQIGPMSRAMKSSEAEAFEKKYGYKPTPIIVAIDTLAVFVNKDNPVKSLSLAEVDAIFSRNRKRGFPHDVSTWGQAGLDGRWKNVPISLYGRNSASGTYGYFKEHTLEKGDYKDSVKEQPGSASVVQGVEAEKGAIGYSGVGYRTSGVRVVPLSMKPGEPAYEASYANALSGKYPLARPLYVYVNKSPNKSLNPVVQEFLKLVLSKEGQEIVLKDGFLPLPADIAAKERAKLQ